MLSEQEEDSRDLGYEKILLQQIKSNDNDNKNKRVQKTKQKETVKNKKGGLAKNEQQILKELTSMISEIYGSGKKPLTKD